MPVLEISDVGEIAFVNGTTDVVFQNVTISPNSKTFLSSYSNNDKCPYEIQNETFSKSESGIGVITITNGVATLLRNTIIESTNNNQAVDFKNEKCSVYVSPAPAIQVSDGVSKAGYHLILNDDGYIDDSVIKKIASLINPLSINQGGTGANTAAQALSNLGAQPAGNYQPAGSYANTGGDALQIFQAANGTGGNDVVNYAQMHGTAGAPVNGTSGTAANTNYDFSSSFTAPAQGFLFAVCIWNNNGTSGMGNIVTQIILDGSAIAGDNPGGGSSWFEGTFTSITAGTHTVTFRTAVQGSTLSRNVYTRAAWLFIPSP